MNKVERNMAWMHAMDLNPVLLYFGKFWIIKIAERKIMKIKNLSKTF